MHPFIAERSKTHEKKNAQFRECQRHNRPLVTITPRRQFALVEIDMFTTDKNLDDSAMREIQAVFAEHVPLDTIKVSAIQCVADRIPRASAEAVATKLFETAVQAMPHLPPAVPTSLSRERTLG
jgi:hypothetical protein